jgi:hypothetical protein
MRKIKERLSALLLFLYSIACFRNDTDILYKKLLKETCSSSTSTQIEQHNTASNDWKKVQDFMVAVSIYGTSTKPYNLQSVSFLIFFIHNNGFLQ